MGHFRFCPTALKRGGMAHKRPGGYVAPATCGIPTASERGAESEVAHLGRGGCLTPAHLWGPHRFTAGGRIRSGPQVGQVAT